MFFTHKFTQFHLKKNFFLTQWLIYFLKINNRASRGWPLGEVASADVRAHGWNVVLFLDSLCLEVSTCI